MFNKTTCSCNISSRWRLEKQSSMGTIIEVSSWSISWSESTTVLLFFSPIISGKDPIISFFKWTGQIDNTWNSFSVNASESTRKSSHLNWLIINLAMSSSRHKEDDLPPIFPAGSTSKYSGSFSSSKFWMSDWTAGTSSSTLARLSLRTDPSPSRFEGVKMLL